MVADVGLDYRFSQAVTLGISYDGQAGQRANDNAVRGSLEVKF